MATFAQRLKKERLNRGLKQSELAETLFLDRTSISKYETGKQIPETPTLEKLADFFQISVDYLLGKIDTPNNISQKSNLNKKDERDIEKALSSTLEQLENVQEGLMFDGEILDDETRELLIGSLERAMRLAKKIAKDKYTPNKYKKDK